ncbi:antitoxin VbhA family protein [Aliihoeflea sp. 2WW]|uniref:antitoxin VbhA family protein n=1 Tax=Aliihoeflea sp. 2WW TaxID=1381123 RepID=UPI000463AD43|nr:antitoxin VbhA family protein [Aliihoeflea sp. 2WW]
MKTKGGLTVEEIVEQVAANARIEGHELDAETLEVVRKIAGGEMSADEVAAWGQARAAEDIQQHKR